MRLRLRKSAQALNPAYARQFVTQARMDTFRGALARLFSRIDENESEEHQKTIIAAFLTESFGSTPAISFSINTHESIDLVVQRNVARPNAPDSPQATLLIETRRVFAGEMMTPLKNNVKALHELILCYFENDEQSPPIPIRQLIITDVFNWFILSEHDFRHFFYTNPKLNRLYQLCRQQRKASTFFYSEAAKILRDLDDEVPVTYLNLREAADLLNLAPETGNQLLIPAYNLLSPEHLFGLPFTGDADALNRRFYVELLHIIGLHETKGKKAAGLNHQLISRLPDDEHQEGSLLEQVIKYLQINNSLSSLPDRSLYGQDETEQLVNVGLDLCMLWLGRLFFLKFLEGQLLRYHRIADGNPDAAAPFRLLQHIRTFRDLNELFFDVLAVPPAQRSADVVSRYGPVPYVGSSLFDPSDLERNTLPISNLSDQIVLPLFEQSLLNDQTIDVPDSQPPAQLSTLRYLLRFLNSCDFDASGQAKVQAINRPLITATSLGFMVDQLIGGLDGTFIPPEFMTTYVVHDAIHKAALTRLNQHFGWDCTSLIGVRNLLDNSNRIEANAVLNSLRIVDPAVGSGNLLITALNELIALKAELGILTDRDGHSLHQYVIAVVDNELVVTHENGESVEYVTPQASNTPNLVSPEGQRVQETIFHEKQTLLENCLFGVDTRPVAVTICRLRLGIELLKHAYYVAPDKQRIGNRKALDRSFSFPSLALQPLPNLDVNSKVGNALISRFKLDFQLDTLRSQRLRENFLTQFRQYRVDVLAYKQFHNNVEKAQIWLRIRRFREFIRQFALDNQKESVAIRKLEARLAQSALTFDFVGQNETFQQLTRQLADQKRALADEQSLFEQAVDWRFDFPEVLDVSGAYEGFDVVLGSIPYRRQNDLNNYKTLFRKAFPNTYVSTVDHYVLYIEQGFSLLRPGGQLAYVLPDKWLRAAYGTRLRRWLRSKAIEQIIHFPGLLLATAGKIRTSILIVRKADAVGLVRVASVSRDQVGGASTSIENLAKLLADNAVDIPIDSLPDGRWDGLRSL